MRGVRTVGALRRGSALAIDAIVAALATGVGFAVGVYDAALFRVPENWFWTEWWFKHWLDSPEVLVRPVLGLGLFLLLWTALFEALWSRTPGDVVLRLRVVDGTGHEPGVGRVALRALGSVLNVATLGLGWLVLVVTPRRRALHDLLSGTYVIAAD